MTLKQFIGDSHTHAIPLTWPLDGAPFSPGADWLLIFTLKAKVDDADTSALFQKASGAGISVTGSTAAVSTVPQDTMELSPADRLPWDIQAQHVTTGEVRTVAAGRMSLSRDVTRQTTTSVPVHTAEPPVPVGPPGPANTLSIGLVTTGAPGSAAAASISGTAPNQTLNLTLPAGSAGPSNTLSIGLVTTGAPGSAAAASISGAAPNQTLNLTLPAGSVGPANTLAIGLVTTGAPGSAAVASISGSAPNQTLNLTIPAGQTGLPGQDANVNATNVAAVLTAAESVSSPGDSDGIVLLQSGVLKRTLFSSIWTWIVSKIGAITSITAGGAWSFSSVTRPTSSATGTPSSSSLILCADLDDSELWTIGRLVRMTTTNIIGSATGNATGTAAHGQLQLYSGTNAGSSIGHYLWRPLWTVAGGTNGYRSASQACGFAFRGLAQFGANATNKYRIWFAFNSTAAGVNLADASEPVASTAIGMEFWISGTTRKVRMFYRKDGSTATVFSATYDLTYVSDTDIDSFFFRSDGTNLYLYYLPSHPTNRRISQTPVITWANAISAAPAANYYYLCASAAHPSASPTSGGSLILQSLVIDPAQN